MELTCTTDKGTGRPTVIVVEHGAYPEIIAALLKQADDGRVVVVECSEVNDSSWAELALRAIALWKDRKLKQARVVGLGSAAILAQKIALEDPKEIRNLAVVDGAPIARRGVFQRLLSRLDELSPFGLPFRVTGSGFDSRPFLHRLRCPTLLVQYNAGLGDLSSLEHLIPTANFINISDKPDRLAALTDALKTHQNSPAKLPAKSIEARLKGNV